MAGVGIQGRSEHKKTNYAIHEQNISEKITYCDLDLNRILDLTTNKFGHDKEVIK